MRVRLAALWNRLPPCSARGRRRLAWAGLLARAALALQFRAARAGVGCPLARGPRAITRTRKRVLSHLIQPREVLVR
jgi:hypothetical protein